MIHVDFNAVTMDGVAAWLTQRSVDNDGPEVVDMTGLTGRYDGAVNVEARTPMAEEIHGLGLKLEPRKAMVEQLIIDHVEKTPTGN